MEKFTQKWAVISLLEDKEEGAVFDHTEFPLHVTLAGVFAIDHDEPFLAANLQDFLTNQKGVEIQADQKEMFGPNQDVAVMKIKQTPELMRLYREIHEWLNESGAVFNEPQYEGEGYLPHSTFQKNYSLESGSKTVLKSVSLIDLFPDNNGYKRKISKTIQLN